MQKIFKQYFIYIFSWLVEIFLVVIMVTNGIMCYIFYKIKYPSLNDIRQILYSTLYLQISESYLQKIHVF